MVSTDLRKNILKYFVAILADDLIPNAILLSSLLSEALSGIFCAVACACVSDNDFLSVYAEVF